MRSRITLVEATVRAYHGSTVAFDAFDRAFLGTNTGHPAPENVKALTSVNILTSV